ncbi:MAG TPA: ferritin-like domain-containing protein [Streptosporangiaceae bacterium]|nr:ferritin-like domain-containing protein [Streptosporangiaceae bacterium]
MSEEPGNPVRPRGRLAQVIATRGGQAPPEAPFVIEHREALIYILCQAAELEHGIMAQYLFAAFSLKQSTAEGLTDAEAVAVQRWRRQIAHIAAQEMLHLALVQNLLSAIGAAPHLTRPNFPQPASHYPAGVHLALLPFSEQALRHFMFLERPEGMALHDAEGLAAFSRAAPFVQAGDIVPRGQDFATVGHLYRSIEAGVAHLADKYGEDWLFVGPPRAQATAKHFSWPELVAVADVASAQRAINEILEQGEGPRGAWQDAHFGQFVAILDEFEQLREANRAFDPARPVVAANVRPSERDPGCLLVTDPTAKRVMDLFNVCYEILLLAFQRFFAHTEESDAQLAALADATVALMVQVIKPLGDLITTLPAGPEYPGQTAGPSFELFYESDYLLPHRNAAWVLLAERIDEAAVFCESASPELTELAPVCEALHDIARSLTAHIPGRETVAPAAPSADRSSLLAEAARLHEMARVSPSSDDSVSAGLAEAFAKAYRIVGTRDSSVSPPVSAATVARVVDSVLRPLAVALGPCEGGVPVADAETAPASPADVAWDAAQFATRLRARLADAAPPGLLEATAALQHLACQLTPRGQRASRVAELAGIQASLPAGIIVAENGPYLATNVPAVRTYLGEQLAVPPQLALCRCGQSAMKPFCDGTHARSGFSGEKDPNRVPDQRDCYPGQQVTIFDNRGICQHSGLCTDRLPTVFRTDAEPFVAPSGGRLDEIIRAVRDCPSGALSLALGKEEARLFVDWDAEREAAIEVSLDGPYRVTGAVPLFDASGADVIRAVGSSREHYALCRCGHSRNKPFFSGMHWYAGFRDPMLAGEPTLFQWAGGLPALIRMTRLLYEKHVPADDLLAPAFANVPPGHPQREAIWLAEVFGGPAWYSQRFGGAAGPRWAHAGHDFTDQQRARWVTLAMRAADEARMPDDPEFRSALAGYLDWSSRMARTESTVSTAAGAGEASAGAARRVPAGEPVPTWDWGPAGPPAPVGAEPPEPEQPAVALPGPGETVSFEAHVKPLFRSRDRQSMLFVFDLWSPADVQAHAADILARLRNGTMPCDGAWPQEKTGLFQRWAESGFQP